MPTTRINAGCGQDHRPDWINVDIRPEVNPDHVADLRDPWNFIDPGTADLVLFHNVLEHILRPWKPLHHAWTALKPGGRAIVIVPHAHGRRYERSWDHVTPFTTERLRAPALDRPQGIFADHAWTLEDLGPERSFLRRLREWWNWRQPPNLKAVYQKPPDAEPHAPR